MVFIVELYCTKNNKTLKRLSIKNCKQEMFVKHVCPPKLKCHCDLDLWPRNPKFNRGHLLVMTNHHTKLDVSFGYEFCSYWLDKVCLLTDQPTDQPTDRLTDICKAIYFFFEGGGGIIKGIILITTLFQSSIAFRLICIKDCLI